MSETNNDSTKINNPLNTTGDWWDVQEYLKEIFDRPLPKEALKIHPTKSFLTSIKPQYVYDRFNEAFGIGGWTVENEVVSVDESKGMVIMKVVFKVPLLNIYYDCIAGDDNGGAGKKGFDIGDAYKGATTDALGKISSWMGIGGDVYKGLEKPTGKTTNPKNDLPWMNYNDKVWKGGISRNAPLDKVMEHYKVSKENQEKYKQELVNKKQ